MVVAASSVGPLELFAAILVIGGPLWIVYLIRRRWITHGCDHCGARIPEGVTRCSKCGHDPANAI